jgi:nicotinic acid phosphoribosyltransferase
VTRRFASTKVSAKAAALTAAQHGEGQAFGGLRPDSAKPLELVDQALQRFWKSGHGEGSTIRRPS